MSAGLVAFIVGAVLWLLFVGGVLWWKARKMLQSTPWRVVRVLLEGQDPYEVHIGGGFRTTWNPAKPLGASNGLSGPGVGAYRLDESGNVHLTWTPKGGAPRELSGPIPDRVRPNSEQTVRMRRLWHSFVYVYLTTLVVGFAAGFAIAGGTAARRLAGGAIGVFVAIVVLSIAGTVLSAVRSFRHPAARPTSGPDSTTVARR